MAGSPPNPVAGRQLWYQLANLTVTLAVLVWCWARRPDAYRRARWALVLTNVAGLAVFVVFPVAPPRLLNAGGYVDAVPAAGFGVPHGGPVAADQYAAMPSLHLAWATWSAVVAMTLLPRGPWRRLCLLHPTVTGVVVLTGNHYVLDVLARIAVAGSRCWRCGLR